MDKADQSIPFKYYRSAPSWSSAVELPGMQASLDLADQGFKVYLVENKSAIGGKMAQLDKTFPTNDCAMCTISPKLVETGRHPNIEMMTETRGAGCDRARAGISPSPSSVSRVISIRANASLVVNVSRSAR